MASNSFKVKNSLVLTPKDLATLVSPEAGDLACDINDSNKIKRYDVNSASWVEVGSGGGVGGTDIFFVQDFESASLASFTQTGLTLSQTDPLHGKVSALLTHQAGVSPTNDQSFKQVIPVDRKFRGESMTLRLNCKSSASAGNVTIKIYDETNAANIVASEQLQLANDVSGAISQVGFTIPATCASISYTITALPEAGSPVTRIDDIIAELAVTSLLETSVVVPVLTAWQGYTPTFQGFGTPSAIGFEWRQVGENVEIRGKFTSGTSTAVEARVGLPAGLSSAGTAIIPSIQVSGVVGISAASAASFYTLIEPSTAYVALSFQSAGNAALTKQNGNVITALGTVVSIKASVPCASLSATTSTSIPLTQSGLIQEADSMIRLDTANGYGSTATKIRRFTNIRQQLGSDILYQDSATNGASFTALTSGVYSVIFSDSATSSATIGLTLNSSQLTTNIFSVTANTLLTSAYISIGTATTDAAWTGYLSAGDVIRAHTDGIAASGTPATFTMAKQGSLKQVTVNTNSKITIPTSELRFEGASARGAVATAIVRFDAMVKIRGDAFSVVSTAANGTAITMLKAGKLDISASLLLNGALAITRNQLVLNSFGVSNPTASEIIAIDQGSSDRASAAASVFVNVGDVLRVASDINPTSSVSNNISFSFQEQDIQVSVTNTLPTFSESDSSVRVDTANGYGSTGTMIRRFSNVRDNIGVDVEYVDSATNGASFTAKTSGIYEISYVDLFNTNGLLGISKNAPVLTDNISALTGANRLSLAVTTGVDAAAEASWSGYLVAGDVIRAHTNAGAASTVPDRAAFTMSKVGKPNVTGVNVTPFVNVPQPDRQASYISQSASFSNATITGALTSSSGQGIYSYNSSTGTYTALKAASINVSASFSASGAAGPQIDIVKNGTDFMARVNGKDATSNYVSASSEFSVVTGDTFTVRNSIAVASNFQIISVTASALSDQILTAPETFSTDTAALTYAGSGTYTLATLANAPVGTYVTFTYAASTNTRTQTSTRPTQTDADMNANGIMLTSRVYAAASTAALPSTVAVQVGKGLKGCAISAFAATAKAGSCSLDFLIEGNTTTQEGVKFKDYDEKTGIVFLDVGYNQSSIINTNRLLRSDTLASTTTPYFVINASKNPALTGMNLNRVAATYQTDSGQSIPQATVTQLVFEDRVLDSSGAMNTGTGVYTIPENGVYSIQMKFSFGGSTNWTIGEVAIGSIRVNGVEKSYSRWNCVATTGAATFIEVPVVIYQARLAKGDAITLHAYQDSGAALSVIASAKINQFIVTKVSE